jgi:hypothetical protein
MSKLEGSPDSFNTAVLRMFADLIRLNGRRKSRVGYTNAFPFVSTFAVGFALASGRDVKVHNK